MIKENLCENELVDIFIERMREFAVKSSSGTYNKQDPTHFWKMNCEVFLDCGFTKTPYNPETCEGPEDWYNGEPPDPETVIVNIKDWTWGIDFEFLTSAGKETGYWSRDFGKQTSECGEWCRCTENFEKVMIRLFKEGRHDPEFDDPMGCLSMYE